MLNDELERARLTLQAASGNNQTRITQLAFNDGWNAAITHLIGVPHLPYKQLVLKQWLEKDFKEAIKDPQRLRQLEWLVKIGLDKGDPALQIIQLVLGDFVRSLIDGTPLITEPIDGDVVGNTAAIERADFS